MRIAVALTLILAAAYATSLAAADGGGPTPPQPSFATLPAGWHTVDAPGYGAYALSWRYKQNMYGWANSMPKNSIAVSVFFPPRTTHFYPPLRLVMPTKPATVLEGAPDTPEYRIHGHVYGRDVEVWIDIRRPQPTTAQLRTAQRVLSTIRFAKPS